MRSCSQWPHTGDAFNVIPRTATMGGTVRTLLPESRSRMRVASRRWLVRSPKGWVRERPSVGSGYPVTNNVPELVDLVHAKIAESKGEDAVCPMEAPVMGAEDFSYYGEKFRPASSLGLCPDGMDMPNVHESTFDFSQAIPLGVETMVRLALGTTGMTVVDPADLSPRDRYGLMINTVVPHGPIAVVGSVSQTGQLNLARSLVSTPSPHPLHGDDRPGQRPDGTDEDTLANCRPRKMAAPAASPSTLRPKPTPTRFLPPPPTCLLKQVNSTTPDSTPYQPISSPRFPFGRGGVEVWNEPPK